MQDLKLKAFFHQFNVILYYNHLFEIKYNFYIHIIYINAYQIVLHYY